MEATLVSTADLAKLFQVSERQIQRLVEYGVIEPSGKKSKKFMFDLATVTAQYATFLQSDVALVNWAPDA